MTNNMVTNDFGDIKIKYFIGIDVSKHTLDFAVIEHQHPVLATTIAHEPSAIKALLKTCRALPSFSKKRPYFAGKARGSTAIIYFNVYNRQKP